MPSLSSRISHRQGQRFDTIPKPLKCQYCERWFKNASGRTKHVGVYHARGERNLRQAFEANAMELPQQIQPLPEERVENGKN